MNDLEQVSVGENADFILVASTLLLIKSKSLLPTLDLTDDEEQDIHDLEFRLKLYKKIKELSVHVESSFGSQVMFEKEGGYDDMVIFSPGSDVTTQNLIDSIQELVSSLPKKEKKPEIRVRKVITLEIMINNLIKRVKSNMSTTFKEFTSEHKTERVNVIVGFLAMLELVKQGTIAVTQEERYGEIRMESDNVDTPHYM